MARGESRKRKPGTPDYRKRFWAAVTAIVVAAGSIGVSHAGFTLPNQAQKQVQMAAAETEPAEQTAKKQVPNAAKRSLELEDAQGIQEADAAAVADQSELESDKTTASGFRSVDETVYATENLLNVRSGCGTEYEIVTQLNQGDSVQRVGIGDGWSEVLYKDKSCFIRSEYLTTTEPGRSEPPTTYPARSGAVWAIPFCFASVCSRPAAYRKPYLPHIDRQEEYQLSRKHKRKPTTSFTPTRRGDMSANGQGRRNITIPQ